MIIACVDNKHHCRFTNFLGGSPLNRLSWLRTSTTFLNAIADAPSTRYLIFRGGNPLVSTSTQPVLARLPYETVSSWLGSTPIFGQGQHDGSSATTDGENEALPTLEASRFRGAPLVFLGLQEPAGTTGAAALPSSDFSAKSSDASTIASRVEGTPFFALDVTTLEQDAVDSVIQTLGTETEFGEPRTAMARMDQFEAALFAEARTMVDWNSRNKASGVEADPHVELC
jgi:NAD+ diphosphatase